MGRQMKAAAIALTLAAVLIPSQNVNAVEEPADLATILEPIRKEHKLVALAAGVVSHGELIALGSVGERKHGSGVKVTVRDKFHLGSCTKAMTGTLIGMLVEQGKLGWDTTLAEAARAVRTIHKDDD